MLCTNCCLSYQEYERINHMRFSILWDVTHRRSVVSYRRFGTTYRPILKYQSVKRSPRSSAWTATPYRVHTLLLLKSRGWEGLIVTNVIKVLSPTHVQENRFKKSIKIYITTAPTSFVVVTIIRECTVWAC